MLKVVKFQNDRHSLKTFLKAVKFSYLSIQGILFAINYHKQIHSHFLFFKKNSYNIKDHLKSNLAQRN
jgi:hypothetical protein